MVTGSSSNSKKNSVVKGPYAGSAVIPLSDKDFVFRGTGSPSLKRQYPPGYIIFFAEWCGYCQDQVANYRRLAEKCQHSALRRSAIYAVDCTAENSPENPAYRVRTALNINGYPTFCLAHPVSNLLQIIDIRVSDLDEQGLERLLTPLLTAPIKGSKSPTKKSTAAPTPSAITVQSGGGSVSHDHSESPRLCMGLTAKGHFRCTREVPKGELFCWQHREH